jgi:neopullulanase
MKIIYLLSLLLVELSQFVVSAQNIEVYKIEHSYWKTATHQPKLELCLYGKNIADANASLSYTGTGISLEKTLKGDNADTLFLLLNLAPNACAGTLHIILKRTFPVIKNGKIIGGNEVTQSFPYIINPPLALKKI